MEKYTLVHPIEADGKKTDTVSLRRPKYRDIKKIDGIEDNLERMEVLLIDLGQMTPAEVAELDYEDFTKLSELVGKFFPDAEDSASETTNHS